MTDRKPQHETLSIELQRDEQSRERIAHELNKNFMVEAAAGTGKTTCIVNRMTNLLATGACTIEQLVAVTFTRKAAAELRERFQIELRRRASNLERDPNERLQQQRLAFASDNSSTAFVGTIHSFCAMLLRERPIEFGVDPRFRELDENEDAELRESAWHLNIDDLINSNDPLIDRLDQYGLERNQLRPSFSRFIDYRDIVEWPTGASDDLDLETVQNQTRKYVEHMKELVPSFPMDRGTDKLMNRYEEIVRASYRAWRSRANFFQFLELFDSNGGAIHKCWPAKLGKAESERFNAFRSNTVTPSLQWWYRQRYQFVVDFLRRAVSVYERLRLANKGLGFSDLLMTVRNGLRSNASLRKYFASRFTHLLVDEFQDTDPVQAEMILFLTADDPTQQDWQKCNPRAGSLFLVGDPKQSIYRFRRGDIVTYNRVKEIFECTGGEVLHLSKNFRSRSDLIEWNNRVFNSKFASNNYQPKAESMLTGRTDLAKGELIGIHKLSVPVGNIEIATAEEADAIARFIRYAIDCKMTVPRTQRELDLGMSEQVQARDFLVIPHNKIRIHHYKRALDRYGIPCAVNGSNAISEIHELEMLSQVVLAVDDPQNAVHYLALLRDRLFGFCDVELYDFRCAGGRFSYTATVPDTVGRQLRLRFESVNERLLRYQSYLKVFPFAVALENISKDLGLHACTAASGEGDVVAGGMMRAIESLRQHCFDFDSVTDMVSYLTQLKELNEVEGCTALPPSANVVRLMNVHKAKGLEAPIVFLAETSSLSKRAPECHINRTQSIPVGYMGIERELNRWVKREVATPPNWSVHQEEEKRFLQAEHERLLYVATTRAACMLVISVGGKDASWSGLYKDLANAPQLQIPSDEQLSQHEFRQSTTGDTTISITTIDSIKSKWSRALTPTYAIETAKHLGLKGVRRPRWEVSGDYGYQWGSAVHELLETAMKRPGEDLRPTAIRLTTEYRLGTDRVDELLALVESVSSSNIWRRAQAASQRFSELPFETSSKDSENKPVIVRGVIDLIFEEPAGWVIVDYKTDDITELDVATAVTYYRGQLLQYEEYWKTITGQPVYERGLYFTRLNRYVKV